MRVTNNMIFTQSHINISKQYEQLFKINEMVTSGKRINRPSDDPGDIGKVLGYKALLCSLEQYKRNIETGSTWLNYTEAALSDAEQVFMDAQVLAEQMATGTYNEEQREMLAGQAEQLFDHLMQVANTKVSDRHIFSGFKTDTTPFTRDNDYNVEYHGDDNQIRFTINQNTQVTVNVTGQRAFLSDINCFDVLRDLRNALQNDDQHGIQEALPRINEALRQIVKVRTFVGTAIQQMDSTKMMIEDFSYKTSELLSVTEDADLIEAVTKLKEREIAYEASLKSTSLITGLSLVNFL